MTHLEWGLLMVAAALVLGGLASGPVWYAAGHRHGREDRSYGDEPDRAVARHPAGRHRHDAVMPGVLLELPTPGWASSETGERLLSPVDDETEVGAYGPFPVPEEDLALLTSSLLPIEYETHVQEAIAVANEDLKPGEHVMFRGVISYEDMSVTAWTEAMAADMNRKIAAMIEGTDEQLKEITR